MCSGPLAEFTPVASADSSRAAARSMQTGQQSLSLAAENFVPQTGHERTSCATDPRGGPGSLTGFADRLFKASAVLLQR
jgi:hypothetical protein